MEDNEKNLDSILVALDGSRPSQTAASLAIQIAQRENLLIQGLYVVDDVLVLDPYSSLEKELDIQQRDLSSDERANLLENQGDTVLRWLEDRCQTAGVPVKTELRLGQLHDIINSRAESPRLLAMGRRGRSYDQDTASLGHNFREIAHHPPAPMLIGGDELPLIQRMLLAYDGSMQAKHALFWAGSLQRVWQSHLLALSVADENASSRWLQEMEEQVDESGLEEYRFIGRQGDPATQILQTIIDENVDLVIMGGHQHGALLEWFTGSTLDQVLRSTQVPLFMTGIQ
ncbi:MAG: universal stress protein [Candidatus Promineifilaceae bacterium]|jgi:nucleotide-binding universal stress UspA family protein